MMITLLALAAPNEIEQRAEALLAKLSLTEIIQQTWSPYGSFGGSDVEELLDKIGSNGIGQIAFQQVTTGDSVAARVESRNELQAKIVAASHNSLPASFSCESLHSAVAGGTIFPELVTQGATWDPELIGDISAAIAAEAAAVGIDTAFNPVLNMWVDARFGRLQEGYSENPTLTTAYAVAATVGLQGPQPAGEYAYYAPDKVVALAKHYAAYGAALGGLNGAPAELSERTLREFYLGPWRAFAQAGGHALMASHNSVLGMPMHANDYVTNQILRKEFGFRDGYMLSDCNDVPALVSFRVAANLSHAAAKGIRGGVDLDLQCAASSAYTELPRALSDGLVSEASVRQAAKRVLMAKVALRLFEKPPPNATEAAAAVNTPEHRALALRAAEEGIVLLKNEGALLPLGSDATTTPSIAVIGDNGGCDDSASASCNGRAQLLGSYTQYDGSLVHVATVAEALADSTSAVVEWAKGATAASAPDAQAASWREEAIALARRSSVVVAVLGDDSQSASEWGDRDSLDLPGGQMVLLRELAALGKPLVLVLVTGRTATFGQEDDSSVLANVTAVLSAFRPGQMGGAALANLLTGKASPSGKLAQNWARSAGQSMSGASPWLQWRVGKWVANHRSAVDPDGRVYDPYNDKPGTPLFHFGHGLTYTEFAMSNLSVVSHVSTDGEHAPARAGAYTRPRGARTSLSVRVQVANIGTRAGVEVVQIYCVDPIMEYTRPWKRLLAFQRVALDAGTAATVEIVVTPEQLAFQDDSSLVGEWSVVPGVYEVRAGASSVTDLLAVNVTV